MAYNPRQSLMRAVEYQIEDTADLENVMTQGAEAGHTGFIYTEDLIDFFETNKNHIFHVLEEEAQKAGMTSPEYLASLGMGFHDYESFCTLMSWFSLEVMAVEYME